MPETKPDAGSSPAKSQVIVNFSMEVAFAANGADPQVLQRRAHGVLHRAIEDWGLTGDTDAEVDEIAYEARALSPAEASLDEDRLAIWFATQIADGHVELGSIPTLLARYAMSNPESMRAEFAERMGLDSDGDLDTSSTSAEIERLEFYGVRITYQVAGVRCGERSWHGLAKSAIHATELAKIEAWEPDHGPDSESPGSKPEFTAELAPRFIESKGWNHLFPGGGRERLTRWVIDRATDQVVDAEVKHNSYSSWAEMDREDISDLAESLVDNEVMLATGSDDYQLHFTKPVWVMRDLAHAVYDHAQSTDSSPRPAG